MLTQMVLLCYLPHFGPDQTSVLYPLSLFRPNLPPHVIAEQQVLKLALKVQIEFVL